METWFLEDWVAKLRGCSDSRERRAIVQKLEPLLESWLQVENDVLYPTLQHFLGFTDWIQEARAHQKGLRELLQHARATLDHERILDITDELGNRMTQSLEGIRNVLAPRLVQTLKRSELDALRSRLGFYWNWIEPALYPDDQIA